MFFVSWLTWIFWAKIEIRMALLSLKKRLQATLFQWINFSPVHLSIVTCSQFAQQLVRLIVCSDLKHDTKLGIKNNRQDHTGWARHICIDRGELTHACRLHSGSGVHSVAKQTVSRHLVSHHAGRARAWNGKEARMKQESDEYSGR